MSQYIVSARKYRPDSFESLIGQDNIARTLRNSIQRGKIAHAYLFCGPRGVGKTSTARIFAKAINCSNPSADMEPCGECESCVSFTEGRSYCIHELDAASNNSVDDIRALLEQVQVPPQVGKYSVYIIDEVHMLSSQAFNAFLKTLEEPPAHAIFILATTEKHKILPTILSRCQTYDFNRISIPDIVRNLRDIATREGVSVADESLHVIASKADGAMRDALTIFDQTVAFCGTDIRYEDVIRNLNVLDYEYSFSLVDAFLRGDYASAMLTFDEVLAKGFNSLKFVMALSEHLRDLIVSRTAGLEGLLDLPDSLKARYAEQASRCPLDFLFNALGISSACESGFKTSTNPRLHIEFALMKMAFLLCPPAPSARTAVPSQPADPTTVQARPAAMSAGAATAAAPRPTPAPETSSPVAEDVVKASSSVSAAPPSPQAPEPSPAAVEAPRPAPRSRRGGATGMSMSAIVSESRKNDAMETVEEGQWTIPDDEKVVEAWKGLFERYASRPRLLNALQKAALSFGEAEGRKVMTFEVTNEAQKKWIEGTVLPELEAGVQSALGTKGIRLEVKAAEVVISEEKYLPEEKARDLMEKNPEVKNLVMDLNLNIK